MAKKKSNENEEVVIGETIPPDVEAPEADAAKETGKSSNDQYYSFGTGAYSKLFEQAQTHFSKIADITQEVFDTLVAQGKKVEETFKEKMEDSHATEKAKEFARKAEEQAKEFSRRAEEQAKKFKEEFLNEEKLASYRKSFTDAIEPINVFALNKQIDELNAKVTELEAEIAKLKGEKPAKAEAPKADEAAQKPVKKAATKKKATDA